MSLATALILGAGFLALFLGFRYFWVVWALGFMTVMPLLSLLFGDHDEHVHRQRNQSTPSQSSTEAAIDSAFETIGEVLTELNDAYYEHIEPVFDERAERSSRRDYRTDPPKGRHDSRVDYERRAGSTADALTVLRERYARGDLTEAQFERKLDVLLETESPESADEWRRRNREAQIER